MPWLTLGPTKTTTTIFSCKFNNGESNHFLRAAVDRASLRFHETLRADPLFTDPYIRCLMPLDIQMDVNQIFHKHYLATKFIDDKLISSMQKDDGLRQIVFFTDGLDTRPYSLYWPASTILYDVSPDEIFRQSIQKLEEVGAKIPRRCLLYHIPFETSDIQQALRSKGYNSTRPSIWVLQSMTAEWMDKIFISHGLKVEIIEHGKVARNLRKDSLSDDCKTILFSAEQLQFSDDQIYGEESSKG